MMKSSLLTTTLSPSTRRRGLSVLVLLCCWVSHATAFSTTRRIPPRTRLYHQSLETKEAPTTAATTNRISAPVTAEPVSFWYPPTTDTSNNQASQSIQPQQPQPQQLEPNQNDKNNIWLWRGSVVVLCALWASNFAAAKLVMAEPGVDSSLYALARFGTAALALGGAALWKRPTVSLETIQGAAVCGAWVAFGYLGQTLGLLTTTASRSCVICTLHCVFVAALAEGMRVQKENAVQPNAASYNFLRLVPAAVAVLGVAIVELQGAGGAPTIGDALSFAQPIGFGLGYLQLESLMKESPEAGLSVSAVKLFMVAAFSLIMFEIFPLLAPLAGVPNAVTAEFALRIPDFSPILQSPLALGGIAYTGLVTTALALWFESIAFKHVPATDASIILTTEPLFAAAAGAATLGETFGLSDYIGATLIIGACALAVLMEEGGGQDADPDDDKHNFMDVNSTTLRARPISPE
eukprot:CAMPEP_0172450214 /NCGR_PEP_ID=MMETSP1065-20121228/8656_1 /TAXON_ID=265537 /ORGANISM="Amphiprora paludosa, Strain CCMP125" /LENGTH=463 /DNA_ID=CAMNT_0013201991 /DNA_START=252 /DNA_END=1643 /DNA_ORIENTATION=+